MNEENECDGWMNGQIN